MSKYRFSENKEHNAEVIREMLSYLRSTFQVHKVFRGEVVESNVIEEFAEKVERGDII